MDDRATPRRLPAARLTWLQSESNRWVSEGIIEAVARDRILAGYGDDARPHRGTVALMLMAVVMCGVGVLLVIGYNWQRIGPTVKIAMALTAVAAAFAASAFAYARRHHTLGEVLAFAGTLLFGNGIWLIAQALHLQGHFPDAFLWLALGSLVCAWLVGSKAIGIQAALLLGVWIGTEATFFPRPIYPFLAFWAAAIWVSYQLRSPVMLRILAFAAALWILIANVRPGDEIGWSGTVALTGCALYTAGRWHTEDRPMGAAWRTAGLAVLLFASIPLMTGRLGGRSAPGFDPALAITAIVGLAVLSIGARIAGPVDWAIAIVGVLTGAWTLALRLGSLSRSGMARDRSEGAVQRARAADVRHADSERTAIEPHIGPRIWAPLWSGIRPCALGERPRKPAMVRALSLDCRKRSAGCGAAMAAA